jgi:hypothetical protein
VPFDGNIREGEHRQALRGDLCDAPAVHIVCNRRDNQGPHSSTNDRWQRMLELSAAISERLDRERRRERGCDARVACRSPGLTRPGRSGNIGAMVRPLPRCEKVFNGPEARFGPDKHQGTSASFPTVGNAGRWVRPTYPVAF